ncbi:MAG: extensin family protein [Novosphingobium sp.]
MRRLHRNLLILALLAGGTWLASGAITSWLARHPEHNPWAPLTLDQREGWATAAKFAALRSSASICRADMAASGVKLTELPPTGEGQCRRSDRTLLAPPGASLSPTAPDATCAVNFGLQRWLARDVQPAARRLLGSQVTQIEHYGTYSCRLMRGKSSWSEHATANAIDIAAFRLADGRRISILKGWHGQGNEALFLKTVRTSACASFGVVLSPDYNADHANHLHLDQARWSICR